MKRNVYAALVLASLMVLAVGCDSKTAGGGGSGTTEGSGSTEAASNLAGSIAIEGSSTVEPISNRAKEMFNEAFPGVNIGVSGQGTGNGFKALGGKECDLSDASRPIKQKELDVCAAAGVNFYEVPVAYDGLTIVVNNDNDFVESLTVEQLKKIFREDMAAKTWKKPTTRGLTKRSVSLLRVRLRELTTTSSKSSARKTKRVCVHLLTAKRC